MNKALPGQIKNLTDLIAPSFYELHHDFKAGIHTDYWLKGGRASTKSSFAAIEIITGIIADPEANAVILRKVGDTLRDSVYEQCVWALGELGVSHLWWTSVAPMRLIFKPTNQRILFRGADKPEKIKSLKIPKGYIKFVWYEEATEFGNLEDIRNINQSLVRGGNTQIIYSYNPPSSQGSWINKEARAQVLRPGVLVHHSTYLDVPKEWLGEKFIADAEHLKKTQPTKYAHELLGEETGTGAEVFTNLTERVISDIEISRFDKIYRGLDFGYAADPLHYAVMYYDSTRRRLYIYDEIHKVQLKNTAVVELIKQKNPECAIIKADSAEPRTIAELVAEGLRVAGAKKGKGSVEHGIKWLQDREEIIIDPVRCPNTAREFSGYQIDRDHHGNLKGSFPDRDNHSIDAVRYAMEDEIRNIKWLV